MTNERKFTIQTRSDGKVRCGFACKTLADVIRDFQARVKNGKADACSEWTGATQAMGRNSKGRYGLFTLHGKKILAHRFAYQLAKGPIPDGNVVRHSCDNGLCCNPGHLLIGTQADNMRDAVDRGRTATGDRSGSRTHPESRPRGANHPKAKLTDMEVYLMRELYSAEFLDEPTLASVFGLANVSPVLTGHSWPNVPMPPGYDPAKRKTLHRKNNGLAHKKITDDQIRLAVEMRKQGSKLREIAKKLHASESRIWVLLNGPSSTESTQSKYAKDRMRAEKKAVIIVKIDQMVQSGELTPEVASQIMQALQGGGEGGAGGAEGAGGPPLPPGAEGGMPPDGQPGQVDADGSPEGTHPEPDGDEGGSPEEKEAHVLVKAAAAIALQAMEARFAPAK